MKITFQGELNLNLAEQILKCLDQITGQVSQIISKTTPCEHLQTAQKTHNHAVLIPNSSSTKGKNLKFPNNCRFLRR